MIGQTISHYKVIDKIGEGGMGVVYKAEDTKLDREVAIKFLTSGDHADDISHQRFEQEAKSAAALSHPNICHVYDYDEHEGRPFLVMEYLEGETLREKLEDGPLPIEKAVDYARQIAEALAAAHEQGIIHRDIKPENIMIDESGQVKVMDFGLAKLEDAAGLTQTGSTVGTMAYMSPEQIKAEEVDRRSDIFSLGVVFYEMIAGVTPFRGEHQAAMTYAIVNEEPKPLTEYRPDVPEELDQIIKEYLVKDPEERLSEAREVITFLEKVQEAESMPVGKFTGDTTLSAIEESKNSSFIKLRLPLPSSQIRISGTVLSVGVALVIGLLFLFGIWWYPNMRSGTSTRSVEPENITDRSIAVLPFESISSSGSPLPLAKGLYHDLHTRLQNISELDVKSRNSVEKLKNSNLTTSLIADSIGAKWILEGAVQRGGNTARINVQLIDPSDDMQIWAEDYQRNLTAEDMFATQGEIARQIAYALQAELTPGEKERITSTPTENLDAYHLYAKGRKELAKSEFVVDENLKNAVNYFQRAIKIDSTFALAWSGLADAAGSYYGNRPDTLTFLPVDQETAAEKALKLDPDLAEAHTSMGHVELNNMNAPAALEQFKRAIELKPSYWEAHHLIGELYFKTMHFEQALEHLQIATELNPQHTRARHLLYDAYNFVNKPEKSLKEAQLQKKMGLEHAVAIGGEVRALVDLERYEQAEKLAIKNLNSIMGKWFNAYLVQIKAAKGDTIEARNYLNKLKAKDLEPRYLAWAYWGIGNTKKAIEAYKKLNPIDWQYPGAMGGLYDFGKKYPDIKQSTEYKEILKSFYAAWGLSSDGGMPDDLKNMN